MEEREILNKIKYDKKWIIFIKIGNKAIIKIINKIDLNLTILNEIIYSTATVII